MTWIAPGLVVVLLVTARATDAQVPLEVNELADLGSPRMIELAEFPMTTNRQKTFGFGANILQFAALKFRDALFAKAFSEKVNELRNEIDRSLADPSLGYLLKVQIYTDEFGTPRVFGKQLVIPFGLGREPVDALAEFYRRPSELRSAKPGAVPATEAELERPAGLTDRSFFVWVRKKGGTLRAGKIDPAFTRTIEDAAKAEARRRDLSRLPRGLISPADAVNRAAYWSNVANTHRAALASDLNRGRIRDLHQQFQRAQNDFNSAYKAYLATERELAAKQELARTLNTIDAVVGIIGKAAGKSALRSTTDKEVKTDGTADTDLGSYIRITNEKVDALGDIHRQELIIIQRHADSLVKFDEELRTFYKEQNLPLLPGEGLVLPKVR